MAFLANRARRLFRSREPALAPGPSLKGGLFNFANLLNVRKYPLDFLRKMAKEHGDIVRLRDLKGATHLFVHPDHIKELLQLQHQKVKQGRGHRILKLILGEGLLTSEGEQRAEDRRAIQPAFHSKILAGYAGLITEETQKCISQWKEGERLAIDQEIKRLSLVIVAKTLFGTKLETDIYKIKTADLSFHRELREGLSQALGPVLHYLPLPSALRFRKAARVFDLVIDALIAERETRKTEGEDLIAMLLRLESPKEDKNQKRLKQKIRDHALTFYLAGHETTANALLWIFYLLGKNPQVEAKLHAEIKNALPNGKPGFEDIPQLKYTAKVFKEALRLYPPAWAIGRTIISDFKIGGHLMRKNWECIVSPYITQRDARWFSKADEFIPERWTENFEKELPRCAYFPFGFGPRRCIGEGFAKLEAMLVLASVLQKWKLNMDPAYRVKLNPGITLGPQGPMFVRLKRVA